MSPPKTRQPWVICLDFHLREQKETAHISDIPELPQMFDRMAFRSRGTQGSLYAASNSSRFWVLEKHGHACTVMTAYTIQPEGEAGKWRTVSRSFKWTPDSADDPNATTLTERLTSELKTAAKTIRRGTRSRNLEGRTEMSLLERLAPRTKVSLRKRRNWARRADALLTLLSAPLAETSAPATGSTQSPEEEFQARKGSTVVPEARRNRFQATVDSFSGDDSSDVERGDKVPSPSPATREPSRRTVSREPSHGADGNTANESKRGESEGAPDSEGEWSDENTVGPGWI